MGFYLELRPNGPAAQESATNGYFAEFYEQTPPPVFWLLYGVAGFALVCMGLAAYSLLGDLAKSGSFFDTLLVACIFSSVPFYFLIGLKLVGFRKMVRISGDELVVGFQFLRKIRFAKRVNRSQIKDISLINQRPRPNVAPGQHDDPQYYIRGHWRVVVELRNGKSIVVDRHTEKGALEPLSLSLMNWLSEDSRQD